MWTTRGETQHCLDNGQYSGASYAFRPVGRRDLQEADLGQGKECKLPDTLVLANGERYSVEGLDLDAIKDVVQTVVINSTDPEEVQRTLSTLKKIE
jgi:hypothetical protein